MELDLKERIDGIKDIKYKVWRKRWKIEWKIGKIEEKIEIKLDIEWRGDWDKEKMELGKKLWVFSCELRGRMRKIGNGKWLIKRV